MHILIISEDILGTFGASLMLVYKSEIWPKSHLPHTKSDCIGFRITSGIPVVLYVSYVIQEGKNTASDGCIRKLSYILN